MRTTHVRRRIGMIGAAAAAAIALVVMAAAPASAHVRVDGDPTAGGYAVLTFRVPTESDTASTTKLTVTFPKDTPITYVATQPKEGWTAEVTTADLPKPQTDDDGNKVTTYVTSVTWTATGAGIKPGEFDTFAVSAGPIPKVDALHFPAAQSYSDGSVVDWNQIAQGSTEPEHPAPTVKVAPANDGDAASPSPSAEASSMNMEGSGDSGIGVGLGAAGLGAGVLGLILAIVALIRGNRSRAEDAQ